MKPMKYLMYHITTAIVGTFTTTFCAFSVVGADDGGFGKMLAFFVSAIFAVIFFTCGPPILYHIAKKIM